MTIPKTLMIISIVILLACIFTIRQKILQDSKEVFPSEIQVSEIEHLDSSIQSFVDRYVMNYDFEGIILISNGGQTIYEGSAGKTSNEFTLSTPFPVGSISKVFTAEIVLNVLHQSDINVDDKVATAGLNLGINEKITFHDLLTHASGIPDYYNIEEFAELRKLKMSPTDFASWISQFPLDFRPGSTNSYSNSGYNLLAYIASELSDQTFRQMVQDIISDLHGLTTIQFLESNTQKNVLPGYSPGPSPKYIRAPNELHPSWLKGSGSLCFSANDLLMWSDIISHRLKENPDWKPYGWGVRKRGQTLFLEQSGRIPGYAAHIKIFPEQELSVILLSRIESEAINSLASNLTDLVFGDQVNLPEVRNVISAERDILTDYTGTYMVSPDFYLTVFLSSDGLEIATGKNKKYDSAYLDYLGGDKFFFRIGNTEVRFERNKKGNVINLYWGDNGPYQRTD